MKNKKAMSSLLHLVGINGTSMCNRQFSTQEGKEVEHSDGAVEPSANRCQLRSLDWRRFLIFCIILDKED